MANLSSEALKQIPTERLKEYRNSLRDQMSNLAVFLAQVEAELDSRQSAQALEQAS